MQDESKATKAPKLTVDDVTVDWRDFSAGYIDRLFRAIGSRLALRTHFRNVTLQLTSIKPTDGQLPSNDIGPGTVYFTKDMLHSHTPFVLVRCKDSWIQLERVKAEGKREISVYDWVNGYNIKSHNELFV